MPLQTPERVATQNEILNSGLLFALSHDLVTREINTSLPVLLPTDAMALEDYHESIVRSFDVMSDPTFFSDTVSMAVARFKSCRRQGRDYWGRSDADPLYLY